MNGIWQKCCNCKSDMWVPDALNTAALARRGNDGIGFYCAYGHKQFYTVGESDETKLRRERDQLQQRIASTYHAEDITLMCPAPFGTAPRRARQGRRA